MKPAAVSQCVMRTSAKCRSGGYVELDMLMCVRITQDRRGRRGQCSPCMVYRRPMSILSHLEAWRDNGRITAAQYGMIAAIWRKERVSVFIELNALLYIGVLSFAG